MIACYVALGSNLDFPEQRVQKAIAQFAALPHIEQVEASALYKTKPWGGIEQPDFINAVVKFQTTLSARALLNTLFALEQEHGRIRAEKNGPRTLDCDLLLYGEEIIQEPDFMVPHPRMQDRAFVLVPLLEITPDLMIKDKWATHWLSLCDTSTIEKLA